jgi:hypothetical protein
VLLPEPMTTPALACNIHEVRICLPQHIDALSSHEWLRNGAGAFVILFACSAVDAKKRLPLVAYIAESD